MSHKKKKTHRTKPASRAVIPGWSGGMTSAQCRNEHGIGVGSDMQKQPVMAGPDTAPGA